jgi:cardiolipin synthase
MQPVDYTAKWTVPNAISGLRIVLIVVFMVLLAQHQDVWALVALVGAGVSDFLDGFLARRWNQVTALGRILDPLADRLLTVAVVIGLALREIVPWWLVAFLLARDVVVGVALLYGRRHHVPSPQVTLIGKLATAMLYFFLPLAYLAYGRSQPIWVVAIIGSAAAGVVYWVAGLGYVRDVWRRARIGTADAPGAA